MILHVAKTAAQAAFFWIVFLVVVPLGLRWAAVAVGIESPLPASLPLVVLGVSMLVAASTLNLAAAWAIATLGEGTPLPLDPTRRLVVRGPYRVVRNPMAIAGISQGVGVGLLLGSPLVVAYALAGALVWQLMVRPWEEADLLARFGEPYARYREAVRCWIPGRPRDAVGREGLEPPTPSV